MVSNNVILADTKRQAEYLATTHYQNILGMFRSSRKLLQPPVDSMDGIWSPREEHAINTQFPLQFFGTKEDAVQQLKDFQEEFDVDEIIAAAYIYDVNQLLKSYDIFEEAVKEYNAEIE
jgi:alkanesulfonate monooxygenase SsuD/methylene tetrahydromethanopterin reductase-like flavin-dependent oxidoreductase (luciferase family)